MLTGLNAIVALLVLLVTGTLAMPIIEYGKLNDRWAKSLPASPRMPLRFSIRELMVFTMAIALTLVMARFIAHGMPPF